VPSFLRWPQIGLPKAIQPYFRFDPDFSTIETKVNIWATSTSNILNPLEMTKL
jgi:hypothetical protein